MQPSGDVAIAQSFSPPGSWPTRSFLPAQHSKLLSACSTGVLASILTPTAQFLFHSVTQIGRDAATLVSSHPGSTCVLMPQYHTPTPLFVESTTITSHPTSFTRNEHPDRPGSQTACRVPSRPSRPEYPLRCGMPRLFLLSYLILMISSSFPVRESPDRSPACCPRQVEHGVRFHSSIHEETSATLVYSRVPLMQFPTTIT